MLLPAAAVIDDDPAVSPVPVSVAAVLTPSACVIAPAKTATPASAPDVDALAAPVMSAAAVAPPVMLDAVLVPAAAVGVVAALDDPARVDVVLAPLAWVIVELLPPAGASSAHDLFAGANICHGLSLSDFTSAGERARFHTAARYTAPVRYKPSVFRRKPPTAHLSNATDPIAVAAAVLASRPLTYIFWKLPASDRVPQSIASLALAHVPPETS